MQTYVLEYNLGVITDAINKEIRRGGQVYYLHNRVESIERCAGVLKAKLPDINIGIATAIKNGLIVPVVKNADRLSLQELSAAIKDLVSRARTGKLLTEEYAGGTFTVSNLGMYGITSFNPIINQPESMILGVCAVEQVLRMSPRGIEARDMMGLSLTFDHRLHDGAQAAAFLQSISKKLEKYNEEEK